MDEVTLVQTMLTDDDLLVSARKGDVAALGQLMDRFRAYLLKSVGDDLDPRVRGKVPASDVVQETYLEAYLLFERFNGTEAVEFRSWLVGILTNKSRQAARRFQNTAKRDVGREVGLSGVASAGDETPSLHAVRDEDARSVLAALSRLVEDDQVVIRLRTWEGLSFSEIGARMGRTTDSARMLMARAMKRLEMELVHEGNRG